MTSNFQTPLKVRLFCHSVISDWNNGHAHFLRGIVTELISCGHEVLVFEPKNNWSLSNLLSERPDAVEEFYSVFPSISVFRYGDLDLRRAVSDADLVIVHEWNPPELVAALGQLRAEWDFRLFFNDPHHRAVTDPKAMKRFDLSQYDGVLAFGDVLRVLYQKNGWCQRAWTWHEAADTRIFHPLYHSPQDLDIVWIGNWGDGERTEELQEFLIEPIKALALRAEVYGVRYPDDALRSLRDAGIVYRGALPNAEVPAVFARARATIHVPRRPYARQLPGIPTIRVFEALACGIPLISGPWEDRENLFRPGQDFLMAQNGEEMKAHLSKVLKDKDLADRLVKSGLERIKSRHTCEHRVRQLLDIYSSFTGIPEVCEKQ